MQGAIVEPAAASSHLFDPGLFRPEAIAEETRGFNQKLVELMTGSPN